MGGMPWRWAASSLFLLVVSCRHGEGPRPDQTPPSVPPVVRPVPPPDPVFAPTQPPPPSPQPPESTPPPVPAQILTRGITPGAPPFITLKTAPDESLATAEPDSETILRMEGGTLFHGRTPVVLFTVPGAAPYFASMLGMDFVSLTCPHEKIAPVLEYSPSSPSVSMTVPDPEWAAFWTARAAHASMGLHLALPGPPGNLESLARLLPDVVAPVPGIPYSPLHPFGAQLLAEHIRVHMRVTAGPPLLLLEPAGPVAPLERDLATWKAFRREMEAKYSTMEEANRTWGTAFDGFWDIVPPAGQTFDAGGTAPETPGLLARFRSRRHALLADWQDFLWTHRREVAERLTSVARQAAGRRAPLVALRSAGILDYGPVAGGTDAGIFTTPHVFLPSPGPVSDLRATYLLELARGVADPPLAS